MRGNSAAASVVLMAITWSEKLSRAFGTDLTPCNFPTPRDHAQFSRLCGRYSSASYLCDADNLLSHTELRRIDERHRNASDVFVADGSNLVALVLVRRVGRRPTTYAELYNRPELNCLVQSGLSVELTGTLERSADRYLAYFVDVLHKRWFDGLLPSCRQRILALVATERPSDGDEPRAAVYITAGYGAFSGKRFEHIEAETEALLDGGSSLGVALTLLLQLLAENMADFDSAQAAPRRHSIPDWAVLLFGGCFGLIVLAVIAEWYVVRRRGRTSKSMSSSSAPASAAAGGKSKTHMMF